MPKFKHPAQDRWDRIEAQVDAAVREKGGPGFRFDQARIKQRMDEFKAAYHANRWDNHGLRMDAGYYFARETEAIQAEILMVENAETPAANGTLFPIDSFGGAMARSVVQRQHEGVGRARVGGHAATDAPVVTVIAEEAERKVRPVDAAYIYTVKDIALGDATGQPLDRSQALAARTAVDQELDEIAANGHLVLSDTAGINQRTDIGDVTPDLNTDDWIAQKRTADQCAALISKMKTEANEDTDGRAILTDFAMPPAYLMYLDGLRLGDNQVTARTYIEQQLNVTLHPWALLKDGGASGEDILFGFRRDPQVIKLSLPVAFTQLPPQAKARAWVINCYAETAGVIIDKPNYTKRAALTAS